MSGPTGPTGEPCADEQLREALEGCQRTLESLLRDADHAKGRRTLIVATYQQVLLALAADSRRKLDEEAT